MHAPINYVDLSTIKDTHPVNQFKQGWERCIDDDGIPRWTGFDPMGIPDALPWSMIFRPEDDGSLTYIIFGDKCADLCQIKFQGKCFGEKMPAEAVKDRLAEFTEIAETRNALYSETTIPYPESKDIKIHRGTFPFFKDGAITDNKLARIAVIIAPM